MFLNDLNSGLHGRAGNLIDSQALMNRAVRDVNGDVDLRSTKRLTQVSPGIYFDEYTYYCPPDMKGIAIVNLERQIKNHEEFILTTEEEFNRTKTQIKGLLAFADHDGVRLLMVSMQLQTKYLILDSLNTPTDDGAWSGSGDASNLTTNFSNFLYGSSSLSFDVAQGGTTATITNSTLTPVDLTDYTNNELFVYVYIPTTTNLTSFTLKWGSDSSNYYSRTVTTTHEVLAFTTGWNLLRFAWIGATKTGTPDVANIDYAQFTINKGAGTPAATWLVNLLVARIGDIHNVIYYSKYGWQTSAGVYIENSTASTDVLNADTDEYDLIVQRALKLGSQELRFPQNEKDDITKEYERMKLEYKSKYPSERKILQTTAYRFGSIEGDDMAMFDNWAPNPGA